MRRTNLFVCVMVFFAFTTLLWAQDSTRYSYGLGFSVIDMLKFDTQDYRLLSVFEMNDYPLIFSSVVTQNFRIDIEMGLWRSAETTIRDDDHNDLERSDLFHIGVKVGKIYVNNAKIKTYMGARVAMDRLGYSKTSDNEWEKRYKVNQNRIDLAVGPYFGTEYYFTKNLALGGEAQARLIYQGKTNRKVIGYSGTKGYIEGTFVYNTRALIYLNWYF